MEFRLQRLWAVTVIWKDAFSKMSMVKAETETRAIAEGLRMKRQRRAGIDSITIRELPALFR